MLSERLEALAGHLQMLDDEAGFLRQLLQRG
jgi:hypothetical protein